MTIADKLLQVNSLKKAIKGALQQMGVTVGSTPFTNYPTLVSQNAASYPLASAYTRPSQWPANTASSEGVWGLIAVYPGVEGNENYVSFTASGAFTVDWGDGNVQNFAAGSVAQHQYLYGNANLTTTTLGYKVAKMSIRPQAGSSITDINLASSVPSTFMSNTSFTSAWLELIFNCPSLNTMVLAANGAPTKHPVLETVTFVNFGNVTNFDYLFADCRSLQKVDFQKATTQVTSMSSMFNNCSRLSQAPSMDVSNVTTAAQMFGACYLLRTVPAYNFTNKLTSTSSMFSSCLNLEDVPLFDMSGVTNANSTFNGCVSLKSLPAFNLSSCTIATSFVFNCSSLTTLPMLDLSKCTLLGNFCAGCSNLKQVPQFNTALATDMSAFFQNCYALEELPLLNTGSATNINSFIYNCYALKKVPLFNFTKVTSAQYLLTNSQNLRSIPAWDFAASVGLSTVFQNVEFSPSKSISRIQARFGSSISLINMSLDADAINEIFTNLYPVTGQTISVNGNPGAATCTPSIATAKGWSVIQ